MRVVYFSIFFAWACCSLSGSLSPFGATQAPISTEGEGKVFGESLDAMLAQDKRNKKPAALTPAQLAALAIVRGDKGSGSAFVCKMNDQFFVVTNAHVLSGNDKFTVTAVNGTEFTVQDIFVGHKFDVALIRVAEEPTSYLEVLEDILNVVSIGDEVIIPGNARGGSVVTQTHGKVLGIGPELIEVDAQFVSGNSGSPILHAPSGKILGLATYYVEYRIADSLQDKSDSKKKEMQNRRWFGFRLDTIKNWDRIDWNRFAAEGRLMAQLDDRTQALLALFNNKNALMQSRDRKIQQAISYFYRDVRKAGVTDDYFTQRCQSLMRDLRNAATEDLRSVRPQYGFHREQLEEIRKTREQIEESLVHVEDFFRERRR